MTYINLYFFILSTNGWKHCTNYITPIEVTNWNIILAHNQIQREYLPSPSYITSLIRIKGSRTCFINKLPSPAMHYGFFIIIIHSYNLSWWGHLCFRHIYIFNKLGSRNRSQIIFHWPPLPPRHLIIFLVKLSLKPISNTHGRVAWVCINLVPVAMLWL